MKEKLLKLQARNREIQDTLGSIYEAQEKAKRELTDEEKAQISALNREFENNRREMLMVADSETVAKMRESENKSVQLREYFNKVRQSRSADTVILQSKAGDNVTNTIEASGAVNLKIEDIIDTAVEGLGLPQGVSILTGVVGDEVWPFSINDAEVTEAGEIEAISEQGLDSDSIKAVSRRVAVQIGISNKAIDNCAFDLYTFVVMKIRKALAIYLAKKVYSHANWSGNKGPFSAVTPGTLYPTYENILEAVAAIAAKGFEGVPVITIDKTTEAQLKATPLVAGAAAGFVIQNGLLAGYPYTTSQHINKTVNGGGAYVNDGTKHFMGIGFWDYFVLQQHGEVRLTTDSVSAAVAARNKTVVTLNTEISMTELSGAVNGNAISPATGAPQAFALYELVAAQSASDF